jgi:hypothetical protein
VVAFPESEVLPCLPYIRIFDYYFAAHNTYLTFSKTDSEDAKYQSIQVLISAREFEAELLCDANTVYYK